MLVFACVCVCFDELELCVKDARDSKRYRGIGIVVIACTTSTTMLRRQTSTIGLANDDVGAADTPNNGGNTVGGTTPKTVLVEDVAWNVSHAEGDGDRSAPPPSASAGRMPHQLQIPSQSLK